MDYAPLHPHGSSGTLFLPPLLLNTNTNTAASSSPGSWLTRLRKAISTQATYVLLSFSLIAATAILFSLLSYKDESRAVSWSDHSATIVEPCVVQKPEAEVVEQPVPQPPPPPAWDPQQALVGRPAENFRGAVSLRIAPSLNFLSRSILKTLAFI